MNDLIHSLAHDFSSHFIFHKIASEPIDSFLGPLVKILGDHPEVADVLTLYQENHLALHAELTHSMGMELDPDLVKSILRQGIRNWCGPTVDPDSGIQ